MNRRIATHHIVLPTGARIPVAELVTSDGVYYREAGLITQHIAQSPIPFALGSLGDVLSWDGQGYRARPELRVERLAVGVA